MIVHRPNFLWITTCEQRCDSLGCYGSSWAKTPNLDRLAAEGVLFEHAITPSPQSVPASAAILSGCRSRVTGVLSNLDTVANWLPLTWVFRDHGYDTASIGWQAPQWLRPFESVWPCASDAKVGPFGPEPGSEGLALGVLQYPDEDLPWVLAGRFAGSTEETPEACTVGAARQWLSDRDKARPYFLHVGFRAPAPPVLVPEVFGTVVRSEQISLPISTISETDGPPRWERECLAAYQSADRLTPEQLREARAAYYCLAAFVDHQVGVLLRWMEDCGLLKDTVVVFSSDHGVLLGEHGLLRKQCFYEPVVRTPLVVWQPKLVKSGLRVKVPVELTSLLPSLLDLARLPLPSPYCTESLWVVLFRGLNPVPRPIYSELSLATWGYRPSDRLVMVRRPPWKLSLFHGGPETDPYSEWADAALYNLDSDPAEKHNLIGDPSFRALARSLFADILRLEQYPDTHAAE